MATNYPSALDAASSLYDAVNNLQTTVGSAYTAGQTSLVLADATAFPAAGNVVYVGGERTTYTGKTGNTLNGVAAMSNNHNAGETCALFLDAAHYNNLRDAIIALETALGIASSADQTSIDYIARHKPDLASANPAALGAAAPGTGGSAARDDHVHPTTGLELAANKAVNFGTVNDTLYPSVAAVKAYADGLVVGLLDDRGSYNASGNMWPSSGGSGAAGGILKGDLWYISVAGTLGGTAVNIGDSIRALVDAPGSTASNWSALESNIGYVPENAAYKDAANGYAGIDGSRRIKFGNLANTFTSVFSNANTAARTYLFPDQDATVATLNGVETYTNKRITNRVFTTASTATLTPDSDLYDVAEITAQAADLTIANPTGTPTNSQALLIKITDNGTLRNIAYGTQFRACGAAKTASTTALKTMYIPCVWDPTDSKWDTFPAQVEV